MAHPSKGLLEERKPSLYLSLSVPSRIHALPAAPRAFKIAPVERLIVVSGRSNRYAKPILAESRLFFKPAEIAGQYPRYFFTHRFPLSLLRWLGISWRSETDPADPPDTFLNAPISAAVSQNARPAKAPPSFRQATSLHT